MVSRKRIGTRLKIGIGAVATAGAGALAIGMLGAGGASASIGESYMAIPGIAEGGTGADHRKWLQIETHYWPGDDADIFLNKRNNLRRPRNIYGGPAGPAKGPGTLAIAVDKHSPMLRKLMAACAARAVVPELKFSESSALARGLTEMGLKPANLPDYYEYKLKQVAFDACPVVDGAPEQAVVLKFQDIEWLNYQGPADGQPLKLEPASLPLVASSGRTKAFVLSWFASANDVSDDQCPKMNAKPGEDQYFTYLTREQADKERADMAAAKTSVSYENEQMAHRGPGKLSVGLLPGIVPDPGHFAPVSKVARGLDLDSNDGTGKLPSGVCRHVNYASADGRQAGIDNQLFTVQGCMPGYMGHKGFLNQYRNEQMRNGGLSMIVQISGIDNDLNDDSIDITMLYSKDPMAKDASGKTILADYTFRLANDPMLTHYFARLHGRIVNGVIVTDLADLFQMNTGQIGTELTLYKAGMRLEILPNGSLKGVLGGYEDWRRIMQMNTNSRSESLYGFQAPGLYNAFKRAADGMKDPVTGVCHGISSAYDMEGSPAFIPPEQWRRMVDQGVTRDGKAR